MTKIKRFALATLCFAAMSFAGCTDKSDNPVDNGIVTRGYAAT